MSKTVVQIKLINLWTTQSSLYSQETWGGFWVVIAISSKIALQAEPSKDALSELNVYIF